MNIEISKEFRASLIPYPKETLEPLHLQEETFRFLTETGLPLRGGCEITPNAPLTFYETPYIKQHAHLQNTFLDIASMDAMGVITIDVKNGAVFQVQTDESEKHIWGEAREIPRPMNYSIRHFVDCLGLWLSFWPQFREEVKRQLELDPAFSLFEHEELYKPILEKLREGKAERSRSKNHVPTAVLLAQNVRTGYCIGGSTVSVFGRRLQCRNRGNKPSLLMPGVDYG